MSYNCAYVGSRWLTYFLFKRTRFAVRCRVVTLRQLLWTLFTLLFMLSTCLLPIFLYIFFINIGCATLYYLSMMYVTVYNMSFDSNCRILAAELNYRFTKSWTSTYLLLFNSGLEKNVAH